MRSEEAARNEGFSPTTEGPKIEVRAKEGSLYASTETPTPAAVGSHGCFVSVPMANLRVGGHCAEARSRREDRKVRESEICMMGVVGG